MSRTCRHILEAAHARSPETRTCGWCSAPLPSTLRADAHYCIGGECREAAHRARRSRELDLDPAGRRMPNKEVNMKTMLIAIGLALLIATAAQAEPTQWTDHRVPIPAGKTLELGANGNLTFGVKNLKRVTVFKTTCASHAFASFRNENEHGVGEVQTISFSGARTRSQSARAAAS